MKLTVVSPGGKIFENEVTGFTIETRTGQVTILDGHIEGIRFFDFSELIILDDEGTEPFYVALGYVHIMENEVNIMAQIASTDVEQMKRIYDKVIAKKKEVREP